MLAAVCSLLSEVMVNIYKTKYVPNEDKEI
jgi:hypothetical protein